MKLDHIQLAIPKESENACRAFWVSILGCHELEKPSTLLDRSGEWFAYDDVEIHLGAQDDFAAAKKAHPAFRVTALDQLAHTLASAGHAVRWDIRITGRRRFFTDDPVGNRIEFIEDL